MPTTVDIIYIFIGVALYELGKYLIKLIKPKPKTSPKPAPPREDRYRLKIKKLLPDTVRDPWACEVQVNYKFWPTDYWESLDDHIDPKNFDSGCAETEADARLAGEERIKKHLDRIARDKLTYTYIPDL